MYIQMLNQTLLEKKQSSPERINALNNNKHLKITYYITGSMVTGAFSLVDTLLVFLIVSVPYRCLIRMNDKLRII